MKKLILLTMLFFITSCVTTTKTVKDCEKDKKECCSKK